MSNAFNLLTAPLIRIETGSGSPTAASLPEVYSALMRDEIDSFPALRPHQRHAWHAFLVQLGAMAMRKARLTEPPEDAAEWRRIIRALTPDWSDNEPWSLVVEDITKPAFMQPPASSADKLDDYKKTVETPDELDMLVTTKNHDLKSSVALFGKADDWIFALICLQTSAGYPGRGYYGISRMNGGLGSRPAFSITPPRDSDTHLRRDVDSPVRPGIHARRDIRALLERREEILGLDITRDGGICLVWTAPWDGNTSEALRMQDLDPWYIEICRRVRLRSTSGSKLYAIKTTSKGMRIEAKNLKGLTGDPWTPVNIKEGKSLTLAAGGFTYKRVTDYLTPGNWELPPLFKPTAAESKSPQTMQLVARGMVRGQGKTEGYHERIILFKEKAIGAIGRAGGAQELGDIAHQRIDEIGKAQRILRHAVSVFAAGGDIDNVSDEHRARANPWANKLDEVVDASFFEDVQDEFEVDDPVERQTVRDQWLRGVIDNARELLRQAEEALPCPAIRRYRARVRADSVFEGRIRGANGFPGLFPDREEVDE